MMNTSNLPTHGSFARFGGAIALLVAGCSSTAERTLESLPFHVAIRPAAVYERESETERRGKEAFSISLDSARFADALEESLEGKCFTKVTQLETPGEWEQWGDVERDNYCQIKCKELRADYLLEPQIVYEPKVKTWKNDRWMGSTLLFLVGMPFNWFVNDVTYNVPADLRADFRYLPPVTLDEEITLDDSNVVALWASARFEELTLDMVDRANGKPSAYALGFLIPGMFIRTKADDVRAQVETEVLAQLTDGLIDEVDRQRNQLLTGGNLVAVRMASDPPAVARRAGSGVKLTCELILQTSRRVSDLAPISVIANGSQETTVEVIPKELTDRDTVSTRLTKHYRVDASFSVPSGADQLHLRVSDNNGVTATFTLPIQ